MAYILASRKPDEVYGALSAACYVHSTQAAQKVPVTKKVDDGVYSVCRRNLKYTVLYQQLAKFIPRRLLRKCRRRRRSSMAYTLYVEAT